MEDKMDLTTNYLGKKLKSPLVVSASPISEDIDNIKKMEDAGAAAVVLYSLFEEQLINDQYELHYHTTAGTYSFAESLTYFPEWDDYAVGPEEYLEHIRKAKETVGIPIIASLNGTNIGSWTDYAERIEQAGADAIELNQYYLPTDMDTPSEKIEQTYIDILKAVKKTVKIPVALKLGPFYTNFAYIAKKFDEAGADALVLFNRFYQPDIDLEQLEVNTRIEMSDSSSLRLPLTWIGILKGRIKAQLAATRGIHTGKDVIKLMLAGADVAQLCSVLLKNGIGHIKTIEKEMIDWMTEKEYESIKQMQGSMSQINTKDQTAYARSLYMKALKGFKF